MQMHIALILRRCRVVARVARVFWSSTSGSHEMKSSLRSLIGAVVAVLCALMLWKDVAFAQVRTYDVQWTNTAPTIDAVIGAGEWAAAGPAQGDWEELRQEVTDMDTDNNRFQMMWDANGLYILYQIDRTTWLPPLGGGNPLMSFSDDSLNLYFDPNRDGEENFDPTPVPFVGDPIVDGYQVAFNQYQGTFVSTNADRQGVGFYTEAHIDSEFDDDANWNLGGLPTEGPALQDIVVAQNNGATGGLAEMFFPWSSFDADITSGPGDYNLNTIIDAADYTIWRDTLGSTTDLRANGDNTGTSENVIDQADYDIWKTGFGTAGTVGTSGLYAPSAPSNDDTWFYQMGQITTLPDNVLPVYNYTNVAPEVPINFFATHPHAEITFVGQPGPGASASPEPSSIALLMLAAMGLAALARRR